MLYILDGIGYFERVARISLQPAFAIHCDLGEKRSSRVLGDQISLC
jgi:hypothetical protein